MRSLKSASSSSTPTLKGKRKLAQTKDYPDSPPATPPHHNNGKTTTTRVTKKQVFDLNSPPAKRRRSSDRIANKTAGQKRQSMEDDDGFVFTRPSKQKRKLAVAEEVDAVPKVRQSTKPSFMDFTEVPLLLRGLLKIDPCCYEKSISTVPTTETHSPANGYNYRSQRYVCSATSL